MHFLGGWGGGEVFVGWGVALCVCVGGGGGDQAV